MARQSSRLHIGSQPSRTATASMWFTITRLQNRAAIMILLMLLAFMLVCRSKFAITKSSRSQKWLLVIFCDNILYK